MQRHEAKAICGMLMAYFPRDRIPEASMIAWGAALESFDYRRATEAVKLFGLGAKRMPSLAELIDQVRQMPGQEEPVFELPPPSRLLDRVKDRLSPTDDDLAYLDARSDQRQRDVGAAAFRDLRFAKQEIAAEAWARTKEELGEDASDQDIAGAIHAKEAESREIARRRNKNIAPEKTKKPSDGHEHRFTVHDRCDFCGARGE